MMAALSQAQLREKYNKLKNKGEEEIVKEAHALTEAAAPPNAEAANIDHSQAAS